MKNISTGFGLAFLAGAVVTHTLVTNLASTANANAVTAAASAVSTAATGQAGPTIVWYQAIARPTGYGFWLVRAWSDGRVEARYTQTGNTRLEGCNPEASPYCQSQWYVINDPAQGLTYRSDINFDAQVDGADLGQLLADWGNAPRQDIPPSDCPLNLVNPS